MMKFACQPTSLELTGLGPRRLLAAIRKGGRTRTTKIEAACVASPFTAAAARFESSLGEKREREELCQKTFALGLGHGQIRKLEFDMKWPPSSSLCVCQPHLTFFIPDLASIGFDDWLALFFLINFLGSLRATTAAVDNARLGQKSKPTRSSKPAEILRAQSTVFLCSGQTLGMGEESGVSIDTEQVTQ